MVQFAAFTGLAGLVVGLVALYAAEPSVYTWDRKLAIAAAILVAVAAIGINLGGALSENTVSSWVRVNIVIAVMIGLAVVVASLPRWFTAIMWAGATLLSGGVLGFLFGVPRDQNKTPIEEISTWLTNIIVGASVAQLGTLRDLLLAAGYYIADCVGYCTDCAKSTRAGAYGTGFLLYFGLTGLLGGYLITQLYLRQSLPTGGNTPPPAGQQTP